MWSAINMSTCYFGRKYSCHFFFLGARRRRQLDYKRSSEFGRHRRRRKTFSAPSFLSLNVGHLPDIGTSTTIIRSSVEHHMCTYSQLHWIRCFTKKVYSVITSEISMGYVILSF